jgi:tryptophan halogenase
MDNGWCWTIPMVEDNHHGYVFSSADCSEDEAAAEVRKRWPKIDHERVVRFRSGRHDRSWIGNVYAIGNAYAFVEPLESTGLMMIQRAISTLVRSFPIGPQSGAMRDFVNTTIARDWDRLRWFLAAHFKFNKRLDTPFWKRARAEVDVSGIQRALDLFAACGPLSLMPRAMRTNLNDLVGVHFYGLHGLDTILLGQQVPHASPAREPSAKWKKRQQIASDFAARGLSYAETLRAIDDHPEWLVQAIGHPAGWANSMAAYL